MNLVAISANARPNVGKKANKATRREGLVPCVIYGGKEVLTFSGRALDFRDLVYTPEFKLAEITLGGTTYKCILKEIQFHPVTDEIMHIDFLQLVEGKPLKVMIPLRFRGTAPGVKEGGSLNQKVRRVKIKTMPKDLVPELFVDISKLKLNESVRVQDIEVTENMEIMTSMMIPVATVETPRALRSAEDEELEGEEGEEGEGTEGEEGAAAEGGEEKKEG